MSKITDCIGLLTVMVSAGEQHSEESLTMVHDALDEESTLRAKVEELEAALKSVAEDYQDIGAELLKRDEEIDALEAKLSRYEELEKKNLTAGVKGE